MPKVDKELSHIAPARGLQTHAAAGYASLSELMAGRAASKSFPKDHNGLKFHDMAETSFWQSYDRLPKPKLKWLTSPGPYASMLEVSAWSRAMKLYRREQDLTDERKAAFKAHVAAEKVADKLRRTKVCEDYDQPGACDSARPVDCDRCRHHCMQSGDHCTSETHSGHSNKRTSTSQEEPWPQHLGMLFNRRPDPDTAMEAALAWDIAMEAYDKWQIAAGRSGAMHRRVERAGGIVDEIRLAEVCDGYYEPGDCDFEFQRGWSCGRCRHHCVQRRSHGACVSEGHGNPGQHSIASDHALPMSDEPSSSPSPLSPSRLLLATHSVASDLALSSESSAPSSVSLASWPDTAIVSPDVKKWSPTPTTPEDSVFSYGP